MSNKRKANIGVSIVSNELELNRIKAIIGTRSVKIKAIEAKKRSLLIGVEKPSSIISGPVN